MMCVTSPSHGSNRPPRRGSVAGAVLRAARNSTRATEASLATAAGVTEDRIRAWEDGSCPLAEAPYPQLERLARALASTGADPAAVADLHAACWCDIIITAVAHAEDVVCLLADPLTGEPGFHGLMNWVLTGTVPVGYGRLTTAGPLVTDPALAAEVEQALGVVGVLAPPSPVHHASAQSAGRCSSPKPRMHGARRHAGQLERRHE